MPAWSADVSVVAFPNGGNRFIRPPSRVMCDLSGSTIDRPSRLERWFVRPRGLGSSDLSDLRSSGAASVIFVAAQVRHGKRHAFGKFVNYATSVAKFPVR